MKTKQQTRKAVASLAAILAIQLAGTAPASAGRLATLRLAGQVAPNLRLEAGQPTSAAARVAGRGPAAVAVEIDLPASGEPVRVEVPLVLRGNSSRFALVARVAGPAPEGALSVSRLQAAGGGRLLAPGALESFAAQAAPLAPEMALAAGGRISAGGSFRSAENAVTATLEIALAARPAGEAATLTILLALEAR